jgi:zinc D-Ala-D-Ala carboxypeptidase
MALKKIFLIGLLLSAMQPMSSQKGAQNAAPQPITIEYITGKFRPEWHVDFIEVEAQDASREGMMLRKETYEAFKKMSWAAKKAGIKLTIVSATRNFDYQKGIWDEKWKKFEKTVKDPAARARKIMEYSAMPMCSRHHWGTDIDIGTVQANFFETPDGKKLYAWLSENAPKFGFCQPYTAGRPTGYREEKWHWTYLPLAKEFTEFAKKNLKNEQISGFSGAETAALIDVVKNYVLGINVACQ